MVRLWLVLFSVFVIYTLFVYTRCDEKKAVIPGGNELAGWKVWQEKNCQSCHQVYGLGGYMGPDLTNIVSDSQKNERYIKTFIRYGSGRMPAFNLTDSEVNNVYAFLMWVDKSGKSRVGAEKVTWSGNYNFEN